MTHKEFRGKVKGNEILWGVDNFWFSLAHIFRFSVIWIYLIFISLMAVSSLVVFYFAYNESYWYLIFIIPTLIGCLSGTSNLNLFEIFIWFLPFLLSLVMGYISGLDFYKVGWIPLVSWIVSGVIKGITMTKVEDKLVESEEIYNNLQKRNLVVTYNKSNLI